VSAADPQSADVLTCLGVAHAVNFDIPKAIGALRSALAVRPHHFWARLKYGELLSRLQATEAATHEIRKALDVAESPSQFALAHRQLHAVRAADLS